MPIVSIGTDLAQVSRFAETHARRGDRLLERLFTDAERAYCERRPVSRYNHYVGRFAVKEAVMKVLGTGWRAGVRWVDIEVVRPPGQAPTVELHGRSAELARARGIDRMFVSITHDADLAMAVVVAERD